MSGYLLGVIGMVLFCAVLTVVIPHGKTSKMVHAISRIACVVAILAPLPAYFSDGIENFFGETSIEADEDFIKYCSELRVEEAEEALERSLREKYGELSLTFYWGWEIGDENENRIEVYRASIVHNGLSEDAKREINEEISRDFGIEAVFYEGNVDTA